MEEITLSVFNHGPAATENMRGLLKEFEQKEGIHVRLEMIPWGTAWARLVEIALYHTGPDVSQVGSTWVGDLVRMGALRPFGEGEVRRLKGTEVVFDSVWVRGFSDDADPGAYYSIPWTGDARVVYYRRDLLYRAGVDERTAFSSPQQFERTLARLREKGGLIPFVLPTRRSRMAVHNLASWVWGAGGDFLSPDGKRVLFHQPQALEGFKAYFRLGRYLDREHHFIEETDADRLFYSGQAAVLISGNWVLHLPDQTAEVRKNLATVPVPGVPFVGGHHLVIWRHSRNEQAARKLVAFLSGERANQVLYPLYGLPISESGWNRPPFDLEPYQAFKQAFVRGRTFPGQHLWGLVEKRLVDVLAQAWEEVLAAPESQWDSIVEQCITSLGDRLQLSLQ
ncbi:MAG: extracellular solute-binding protein [Anaerolineales bacterium]